MARDYVPNIFQVLGTVGNRLRNDKVFGCRIADGTTLNLKSQTALDLLNLKRQGAERNIDRDPAGIVTEQNNPVFSGKILCPRDPR